MDNEILSGVGYFTTLHCNDRVNALAITSPSHCVFTGSKGHVKVWNINVEFALWQLECFSKETQIRSIKLFQDGHSLLIGGDADTLSIYDIATSKPQTKAELSLGASSCNALAISPDSKLCYSCDSTGNISVWDLHNKTQVHRFHCQHDNAICMDISDDGATLWTGDFDRCVRSWDLRQFAQICFGCFNSSVCSISCCSPGGLVAVGMQSGKLDVIGNKMEEKYSCKLHKKSVRSLKFSHKGEWFVSAGYDRQLCGYAANDGADLFQITLSAPLTCCDISADDQIILSGSGRNVCVHEVLF